MPTPARHDEIRSLIMRETLRAETAGTPLAFHTLQPLYAEQNAHGIDLSQKVYRLVDTCHLCPDIATARLTLANIGPAVWGDALENVLRGATFPDPVTGGHIDIRTLMDSYYGSCWTNQAESQNAWDTFGYEPTKVRIESTVGQLLAALMQPSDPYYGLHLYAGLVDYRPAATLQSWITTISMEDLMDSQGHKLSLALSVVRDDFVGESEVRIIYSHHKDEPWVKSNVSIAPHPGNSQGFASVPCQWDNLVNSITVRSDLTVAAHAALTSTLATAGISVPIQPSSIV